MQCHYHLITPVAYINFKNSICPKKTWNPHLVPGWYLVDKRSFEASSLFSPSLHRGCAFSWPGFNCGVWTSLWLRSWCWLCRWIASWCSRGIVVRAKDGHMRGTNQHFVNECRSYLLRLISCLRMKVLLIEEGDRSEFCVWHLIQHDDGHYIVNILSNIFDL